MAGVSSRTRQFSDALILPGWVLKIPNALPNCLYHRWTAPHLRLCKLKVQASNTIPVVAFGNLDPGDQLELFMQINENQKAVSPTLRITLEEDLYWSASRLDSRPKGASIFCDSRALGGDASGPLFGKISLGEDKATLQAKPFADALLRCKLLPEGQRE